MVPKTGNTFPRGRSRDTRGSTPDEAAQIIGEALRGELGGTHQATKTVMRWTGASDRSAKHWIGGRCVPSGWHLILLARHSEAVMVAVMALARRDHLAVGPRLRALQIELASTTIAIEEVLRGRADG